jgi:hypothetical protein
VDALAALRVGAARRRHARGQPPRVLGSAVALLGLVGGSLAEIPAAPCGADCGRIARGGAAGRRHLAAARAHFARDAAPVSYVHADARAPSWRRSPTARLTWW